MNGVRAFGSRVGKRSKQFFFGLLDLQVVDGDHRRALSVLSGCQSCTAPKHQEIRERIASEAISAVKSGGSFARREKAGHSGFRGFRIHANAAHHVMAGRADFHRSLRNVDVREFLELVIHTGKFFLHVLGGFVGNIQICAAMFGAASFLDFRIDGAGNDVARRELHALGIVLLHEALAGFVAQDAAFPAHGFSNENPLNTGRPNHSRGMKLHEFHVHKLCARFVSESHAVARVFP